RAGQGLGHEARLGADEGAPPADSAGDPAETHAGAIRGAAEEIPDAAGDAPRDDARAFRPRRTAARRHTASVTELTRPQAARGAAAAQAGRGSACSPHFPCSQPTGRPCPYPAPTAIRS